MAKTPTHGSKAKGVDTTTLAQEKLQAEIEACADKIKKVLEDAGFGLQPYLDFTEFGLIPRVRMAKLADTNEELGETKED